MIAALDSAFPPSPTVVAQAAALGKKNWGGYISTAPYDGGSHFGLYHPWPREGFEYVRVLGSAPIAYCSGWDDPPALKALAATWNVRLCLDVEGGIRGDGSWIQPFLDASGAGLYGNWWVHPNRTAAFHIICAFQGAGDPQATWWGGTPRPGGPCGYQWQGTHGEFGVSVDSAWLDDWFVGVYGPSSGNLGGDDMTPEEHDMTVMTAWRQAVEIGFPVEQIPTTAVLSDGSPVTGHLIPAYNPVIPGPPYLSLPILNQKLDQLLARPDPTVALQTIADLETKLQAAVDGYGKATSSGLTQAESQELADTLAAAQGIAAQLKKDLAP